MKHLFVSYEIALQLKEKGFDEDCFGFYNNADGNVWIKHEIPNDIKEIYTGDIAAPLFQQVVDWFREKHDLHISIESYNQDEKEKEIEYEYSYIIVTRKNYPTVPNLFYNTYYEALNEAIEEAVKLI